MDNQYQKHEHDDLDMTVNIEKMSADGKEYVVNITLTNSSPEPLKTYHHSLPWVGWDSILLVAVETDAIGSIIEKNLLIDDPGPARITIQPGESLSGNISFMNRFPDIDRVLKERDVILFWSYQFHPVDASPLKRKGGFLLLPKLQENER